MANGQQLSREQKEAIAWGFFILGVVLAILVAIIFIARFIFWLSVISFFSSIIYLFIALFIDFNRVKHEDYFDGFPHSLLALGLIILFWGTAHFSFPIGYSELSYQILEWNEEYKEFVGLPYQVTIEALNQTCNSIPDYQSCGTILESYKSAEKVNGISDTAKTIQWIFNLRFK